MIVSVWPYNKMPVKVSNLAYDQSDSLMWRTMNKEGNDKYFELNLACQYNVVVVYSCF